MASRTSTDRHGQLAAYPLQPLGTLRSLGQIASLPPGSFKSINESSHRHIPLNSVAMEAFNAIARRSRRRGHVFGPSEGSHPVIAHRKWWEAVIATAGLHDFHWHDRRHHFASKAVMAGVDLRTLQQLLGHKTLQMVVRYAHLSQSHELAAVEKLCALKKDDA